MQCVAGGVNKLEHPIAYIQFKGVLCDAYPLSRYRNNFTVQLREARISVYQFGCSYQFFRVD